MSPGKKFSGRKTSSSGRGRSTGGKKPFGKRNDGDKKFSSSRAGAKPYKKRDDGDRKPYSDRSESSPRSYDKKFSPSRGGSKPYTKRDDREERPSRDRSASSPRSDDRRDFKKPFDKKFSPSRGGSRPYVKRDDRDERPSRDRSESSPRSDDRRDFKKPFDKKFSSSRGDSKPYVKRDARDERPSRDHSETRRDFNKPFDKKFSSSRGGSKPYAKRDDRDKKPYSDRSEDGKGFVKYGDKKFSSDGSDSKPFTKRGDRDEKPYSDRSDDKKDFAKDSEKKSSYRGKPKPFAKRDDRDEKPSRERSEIFRPSEDGKDFVKQDERPKRRRSDDAVPDGERKPRVRGAGDFKERKPFVKRSEESSADESDPKWNRKSGHEFYGDKKKAARKFDDKPRTESYKTNEDGSIRLNKYISNSGICSRREADELISAGVVSVNGEVMTELGYKVKQGDEVKYNNETLRTEKLVYILVNKPKDFITTMDDPQDRKTVMWLIRDACKERVYPVGRLDRNTTGVLLFTNDGELAKKLTHPSLEIQKIYQVELDAPLKSTDMEKIKEGVTLEDGYIKVDDVAYSSAGQDKSVVGVEIHSGRNRIVRRLFESFGYVVKKLDRVYFAGLSKKDLPRGRWRFLTSLEVSNLKMMTGNKKMQKYFEA